MTRKDAERCAQSEANILQTRVWVRLVDSIEERYTVCYEYRGNFETPSYADPE